MFGGEHDMEPVGSEVGLLISPFGRVVPPRRLEPPKVFFGVLTTGMEEKEEFL